MALSERESRGHQTDRRRVHQPGDRRPAEGRRADREDLQGAAIEKLGISSRAEITAYVRRSKASAAEPRAARRQQPPGRHATSASGADRRQMARASGTVRRTTVPFSGAGTSWKPAADALPPLCAPWTSRSRPRGRRPGDPAAKASGSPRPSSVTVSSRSPPVTQHPHHRARRLGVAADVLRERLLGDSVDGALALPRRAVRKPFSAGSPPAAREAGEVDLGPHVEPVDRLGPPCERLQSRRQPEVVERRRPEAR